MSNREVRDILLRRIVQKDEQLWAAAPADAKFHFHGLRDGAGDVRFFGVTHRTRRYEVGEMDPVIAFTAAETALYSMGKPMYLESLPGSRGCLYVPNWIAPVLLTVEQEAGGLKVTAYTGRSLVAGPLRCRIAMWILGQRFPEGIVCTGKKSGVKVEKIPGQKKKAEKKAVQEVPEREAPAQEPPRRAAKRVASPKKKKAAPKRLQK